MPTQVCEKTCLDCGLTHGYDAAYRMSAHKIKEYYVYDNVEKLDYFIAGKSTAWRVPDLLLANRTLSGVNGGTFFGVARVLSADDSDRVKSESLEVRYHFSELHVDCSLFVDVIALVIYVFRCKMDRCLFALRLDGSGLRSPSSHACTLIRSASGLFARPRANSTPPEHRRHTILNAL
jgi:hypothetical protein